MNKEDLHKTLERLRCELSTLGPEAAPVKDRVNSLIDDLEKQLQDLDNAGHRATMRDRLAALDRTVRVKIPVHHEHVDQIMTGLANMGV